MTDRPNDYALAFRSRLKHTHVIKRSERIPGYAPCGARVTTTGPLELRWSWNRRRVTCHRCWELVEALAQHQPPDLPE